MVSLAFIDKYNEVNNMHKKATPKILHFCLIHYSIVKKMTKPAESNETPRRFIQDLIKLSLYQFNLRINLTVAQDCALYDNLTCLGSVNLYTAQAEVLNTNLVSNRSVGKQEQGINL